MSSFITAIVNCLTGSDASSDNRSNEKSSLIRREPRTAEEIASEVVYAIVNAEKGGKELQKTLENIVGEYGWTEKVAEWTLAKLEQALKEASKLGPVLKEAYEKVWDVAQGIEGFVQEHPVFCTVIALGVLVLIAPWALEALGFAELGPVEGITSHRTYASIPLTRRKGSFAALWQSRYAGYVPKGSLFSFFQRLGMIWH